MTTTTAPANGQAAAYQRLRGHLAYLRLAAAAEALPSVLDAARDEHLPVLDALERLLAIEAEATAVRKLAAGCTSPPCPPPGPSMTTTSPPSPALTRPSSASWPPCGSSARPPTWS